MNYGNIKKSDIANGPGVRVSLFVSGCRNHCKGCFQPETWSFSYGKPYTDGTENTILETLGSEYIQGLTVLGGEPFEPENQRALLPLIRKTKALYPNKTIWIFSGYRLDEILQEGVHPNTEVSKELISLIDVLVDGRFVEEKKNITLLFRGSENQRLIDIPQTLNTGRIVLWNENQARN